MFVLLKMLFGSIVQYIHMDFCYLMKYISIYGIIISVNHGNLRRTNVAI